MNYTWKLTVGDWSHDGHGLTEAESFNSNYELADVVAAHKTASTEHGLALGKECKNYEQSLLSSNFLAKYREVFANNQTALDVLIDDWDGEFASCYQTVDDLAELTEIRNETASWSQIHIGWPSYIEMYLLIAQLHLPDLVWKPIAELKNNQNIGGYGLLSN
jgi:hypothetical protein